jgi:uncharacterized repeat protein (TIGR03803 family)
MKAVCVVLSIAMAVSAVALTASDAAKAKERVLHAFGDGSDAQEPVGDLIAVKGLLYGTTYNGGTYGYGAAFALDPNTGVETVLHSFGNGSDGQAPLAGLIDVKGTLYGTTYGGGTFGQGTVFALNPGTGAEEVLYSFCSQAGCSDGRNPAGGLINVKGTLYGTTILSNDFGAVFALDPNSGSETVLHDFLGGSDGEWPRGNLIDVRGTLYGTTQAGANGGGTIFTLDPNSGTEKVLYAFCGDENCSDGDQPYAGLLDIKGSLYGTTGYGGAYFAGTLFAVDAKTGAETVLHSFGNGSDGQIPMDRLIDNESALYGTTHAGGAYGYGSVFRLNLKTGAETALHSFGNGSDGQNPQAGVIDVNGRLFGTTDGGGIYGEGTVFVLTKP